MKRLALLLPILALLGCEPRVIQLGGAEGRPVDTGSEKLRFVVPEDSKVGYAASNGKIEIVEYVPKGQSVEDWTDMITVVIMERKTAPDIDALFKQMSETFAKGCAVEASVGPVDRSSDGPYPAGLQPALCGKTKKFGKGEAVIYKMIEGKSGFYQVQRSWRFPPTESSRDLPLTKEAVAAALARLELVHLCDSAVPNPKCKESAF